MSVTNATEWLAERTTRLPLQYAVSPLVVGALVFGILAAVAWLFRKDL